MVRVVTDEKGGLRIEAAAYALTFSAGRTYATVTDAAGVQWAELFLAGSLHTDRGMDDTALLKAPVITTAGDTVTVTVPAVSSRWASREMRLVCCDEDFRASIRVEGEGRIGDCHLFGGYYSGNVRAGVGPFRSGRRFEALFNPEPTRPERRVVPAAEPAVLDVFGTAGPGQGHWFFTPPPFCYAVRVAAPEAAESGAGFEGGAGPWMTMGLAVQPGAYQFAGFHYDGCEEAFSLRLTYEEQTVVAGAFETPAVLFQFGAPDPYTGIARYRERLEGLGLVPADATDLDRPSWWHEPIFCGWGAQCCLSNAGAGPAPALATQANYDRFLAELEAQGLAPGIVVIDDKWAAHYGTSEVDTVKWPDLKGWIAGRHAAGQKVLLWWKAWDPDGLPPEQCVRNAAGISVAADPTNPVYVETLRAAVSLMLGPDGYDADGFKIDFTARTPGGPGLTKHGAEWGVEMLHLLLDVLYKAAKQVKPDALIITHTPNPYFADVTDMIRLNDINTGAPVVPQMLHRASVAQAACPSRLIDTDNWPMPNRASWRSFLAVQEDLGVPSLYFTTHVDSLEPLEAEDYEGLRRLWSRVRATNGRGVNG
ncbi:MAG: hypothetical protein K0R39_37 [Symbiobacteriaceae bacterium]|jgi:hypothetical protein|nr:hypothetical protein [Symbiobacteriaceae bacterium]